MLNETREKAVRCLMNCKTQAMTHFPVCYVCGEFVSVLRNPVLRHQAMLNYTEPEKEHPIEVVTFEEAHVTTCKSQNLAPSPFWWQRVAWNIDHIGCGTVAPTKRADIMNLQQVNAEVDRFIKTNKRYK